MIAIRLATFADVPLLPGIEQSAGEAFRGTVHDWVADDELTTEDAFRPMIEARRVRVAEIDGEIVGYVNTYPEGDDLHVYELDVRREWQGQGIGKALMMAAREEATIRGCSAMTLTTFTNLPFNAPFYAHLGFQIIAAPPPRLAAILAKESERGLTDRCAMRAVL